MTRLVPGGLVAGVEFSGAREVCQGFLLAAQQPAGLAAAADGLCVVRVEFDRAVEVGQRLVVAFQREIGLAAAGDGPGSGGVGCVNLHLRVLRPVGSSSIARLKSASASPRRPIRR